MRIDYKSFSFSLNASWRQPFQGAGGKEMADMFTTLLAVVLQESPTLIAP
jgi:hypothetical protein